MRLSDTTTKATRSRWVTVLSWVPRIALALVFAGATIVNVAVLGVSPVFTLFLFALAALTVWLRRHQLRSVVAGSPPPYILPERSGSPRPV